MKALDVETNGLFFWEHKIFGIAHCFNKDDYGFSKWDDKKINEIKQLLSSDEEFVFHNAKFDLHMLQQYGINPPKNFHDTQIMAHLLNENYHSNLQDVAKRYLSVDKWKNNVHDYVKKNGCSYDQIPEALMNDYAAKDARYTLQLADMLYPKIIEEGLLDLYNKEIQLTRCLINIEQRGVLINMDLLSKLRYELIEEEKVYSDKIYKEVGRGFDILSEPQLGHVLFDELKLPVQGISRKSGNRKVDEKALKNINHPIIESILQYRFIQKMRSTYCDNIHNHLDKDNVLHCCYNQCGAVTGRMSCSEPNLQNIPKKHRIRELFIPRPGFQFWFFDYSQQEMRLYAGFANDNTMKDVFDRNEDIYAYLANVYYKTSDIKKGDPRRDFCKSLTLGILYGMGINAISNTFKVSYEEARRIRNNFHNAFPKMKRFMMYMSGIIETKGFIKNPFGRKRRLKPDKGYLAINSLIQGTGGDIMKDDIIRVHELAKDKKSRIILSIHDDIGIEAHETELCLIPQVKSIMEDVPKAPIALPIEIEYSTTNWKDKKKKGDI